MYYEKNQMQELFDLLAASKDSTNPELVWRLARATYELAKASTKDEEKKKLTYEAFALSERALDLDEKNFACHKVRKFMASLARLLFFPTFSILLNSGTQSCLMKSGSMKASNIA
jgi:hypothetical protein